MAAISLCPLCAAEYVEGITECTDCQVALVNPDIEDDPRRAPDDEQVIYELGGWTLDQRTAVAEVMADSHIPHAWDGDELVVHERNETAVDRLLEPIELDIPQTAFADAPNDDDASVDGETGEARATAAALVNGDHGETTYDMSEWTITDRAKIVSKLVEARVKHRWEEGVLVVDRGDESIVDDVLDDFEEGGDEVSLHEEGDETPFKVLESLFLAADRLREDPTDGEGRRKMAAALTDLDETNPPYGVDVIVWHRAVSLADELSTYIVGAEQDQEAAVEAAAELYSLLRAYV